MFLSFSSLPSASSFKLFLIWSFACYYLEPDLIIELLVEKARTCSMTLACFPSILHRRHLPSYKLHLYVTCKSPNTCMMLCKANDSFKRHGPYPRRLDSKSHKNHSEFFRVLKQQERRSVWGKLTGGSKFYEMSRGNEKNKTYLMNKLNAVFFQINDTKDRETGYQDSLNK